jgi:hypothetical protein
MNLSLQLFKNCRIPQQPIKAIKRVRSVHGTMPSTFHYLQVPREPRPERTETFLVGENIVSPQEEWGVIRTNRSKRMQVIIQVELVPLLGDERTIDPL